MTNEVKHLLEFESFRIDLEQRLLLRGQQPIPLSPKAFELLLVLVQRSGQVVLKEDLMKLLWPDTFVEESNLGQHVFQLRKALGEQAQSASYILTVPGRGYRFAPPVRTVYPETDEGPVHENHLHSSTAIKEKSLPEQEQHSEMRSRGARVVAGCAMAAIALLVAAAFLRPPAPLKVKGVRQLTFSGRVEPYSVVLVDGSRLYFTEKRGGEGVLAQIPVAGGEETLVATALPSLRVLDVDLSNSRLLIEEQGPNFNQSLWMVSTAGGPIRRVGNVLASVATAWSLDGQSIFYGHDSEIYKVAEDGGGSTKLLSAPGYITALRLSPDGKLLRFTVRDFNSGSNSTWESYADGRNPHPMALDWKAVASSWGEGESCGDWTRDGKYFVFRTARGGVERLWAIRGNPGWPYKNTNVPVELYASPDHIGDPRFSPDGKKIFFVNHQERRELVRYDSVHRLFVPYLGGMPARLLSFSNDGNWVSYRNETDGSLWKSRVDGTEKLQLTFSPMSAYHSSWSPDDKRIVFGGRLPGEPGRLYSVPADGGKPEALTSSAASDGEPSWSADGRLVLFQRWAANESGSRHSAIYTFDLRTSQARILPGSTDFDGVHGSPDGKYAAASDQANHKLMLFDFAHQRWSKLADGTPYVWGIRWSADSRFVYYQHADETEEQPIFRVRISDRKIEQITSARQILRADVLSYTMTGLAPDGSPLASLVRKNSDIYVLELDLP